MEKMSDSCLQKFDPNNDKMLGFLSELDTIKRMTLLRTLFTRPVRAFLLKAVLLPTKCVCQGC